MVLFVDSTEESSYFGGNFARYHPAVSFQHSGSPPGRYALKADKIKKVMSVFPNQTFLSFGATSLQGRK